MKTMWAHSQRKSDSKSKSKSNSKNKSKNKSESERKSNNKSKNNLCNVGRCKWYNKSDKIGPPEIRYTYHKLWHYPMAPEVVVMTTRGAVNDDNASSMGTPGFERRKMLR